MDAQLRLATNSQEEFNRAQQELFTIAQNTAAPVDDVVRVYARLAPALDEIGRKGDATKVVDALSKALKINGATTAESSSVLQQFSQAMGSGVLRGEEFNAIAEAAPPLMRALAQGLGVPTGALRAMASEGQLTAEVITDLTVQALPDLTKAAEKLPDTVGNAMARLRNDLVKAFGEGDSSGLVTAITKLRELLTDPATVQALNDLAAGMATLAGYTITAAREFTAFAKELSFAAAGAAGHIDELEKLKKTLAGVKAARDGGDFIGRPTATFFMDTKQLDDWVKELEGKIEAMNAKIAGMTLEAYRQMQKGAQQAADQQKAAAEEQIAADEYRFRHFTKYVGDLKSKQGEALKNAEAYLNKQVALERKATQDLEKAKQAQLETQQRYTEALAGLSGGGTASYGAAQDLKVKASQALTSGDVEGAKQYAQAALKMLQDLADAGENTFGFEGFIRSLQGIEDAADKINVDKAKQALDDVKKKGVDLKALLDSLSKTTITVKMDDAALEAVRQQIIDLSNLAGKPISIITTAAKPGSEGGTGPAPLAPAITPQVDPAAVSAAQQQISSLAQALQQQLVIPVTPVATGSPTIYQNGNSYSQFPSQEGFAAGGWTGPGGKYKPAGIVHAGEHVQPQEVVREPGALPFLEMIRRNGFRATLAKMQSGMRGYAEGGLVSSSALTPRFPGIGDQLERAATAGPNMPDLGRVEFDMGGGNSFSMYAERNQISEIRTAAKKFGRTHR
ncbi:tape measure protein [Pseudomonas stutzeri]|nr:tape measure protein [Stutzerimonas stutzeri]